MARNGRWVEAGVVGLLAAGCASWPPEMRDPKAVPEGVDYLMAVQCAGLARAHDSFWPRSAPSEVGIAYSNWAVELAAADGHTWETVLHDIQASEWDFIGQVGTRGDSYDRTARLEDAYGSDAKVCKTLADLPEYVHFGG